MTLEEARKAYEKAKRAHVNAERRVILTGAAASGALGAVQAACPHPSAGVVQGESSREPPFRVCTHCGYAEAGWGDGYTKLRICYDANLLSRHAAMLHVRGGIIPNDVHTKPCG